MHHRTTAAAFASWLDTAQQRQETRVKLSTAVARLRNCMLASALRAWVGWAVRRANHRRRLLPALARLNSRELAAAYASWRATSTALRSERTLGQKVQLMQDADAVSCVVQKQLSDDPACMRTLNLRSSLFTALSPE